MEASGPKLSKDGVVTWTEIGVQLEGVETKRVTVDLALVKVGAERGSRR